MSENEPLTEPKLAAVGAGAGLPPSIPEGMRAVSIRVNEVVGVAGFVIPGTRVDVLVHVRIPNSQPQTRVVLSNVQVLTAGTRYDQDAATREGKPIPTGVVTLVLTPDDSEKLTLASMEGSITLTLRNPLDMAPTVTDGAKLSELLGETSPPPVKKVVQGRAVVYAAPKPVAPAAPPKYTVETIRAAKRAEEEVR
jgi:pilus assembly protein CpaB